MRAVLAVLGLLLLAVPVSMQAWGMDVHRFLTRRAIDGLPPEIRPFFAAHRDFISEHAADPDLWRVIGLKGDLGAEDPNHFLDIDGFGEPAPFMNVPRDWTKHVEKYGLDRANQNGRVPWRAEEIYTKLVTTFQGMARGTGPAYAADNARYLAAVLSHYIEDANQPFHATINHDGQLTNQRGIHSRFETELVLRNLSTLALAPVAVRPMTSARDYVFETLVESQALVAPILAADLKAKAGRDLYDDAYFAALLADTRPILEKRLGDAASGVASAIVGAWEKAGRPVLAPKAATSHARIR